MSADIRKIAVWVEETLQEAGRPVSPASRKAVAVAVIRNPFAGRYVEDLNALMEAGEDLGALLGRRCVEALGIAPDQVQSYGKAAMVGEAGELEHAAAILHPKLGAPLRRAVWPLTPRAAASPRSSNRGASRVASLQLATTPAGVHRLPPLSATSGSDGRAPVATRSRTNIPTRQHGHRRWSSPATPSVHRKGRRAPLPAVSAFVTPSLLGHAAPVLHDRVG